MIQGYVTAQETANHRDLSVRQVQKFCSEGRIPDALRFGNAQAIPDDAVKPARTARSKPGPGPKSADGEEESLVGKSEY